MLDRLLAMVAEGGIHSQTELANRLGVSYELLGHMLEDLVRMGYLAPLEGNCPSQCEACPLAGICAVGSSAQVYTLTEKGARPAGS